jgi:hypothetical protein
MDSRGSNYDDAKQNGKFKKVTFSIQQFAQYYAEDGQTPIHILSSAYGYEWILEVLPRASLLSKKNVPHLSCYLFINNLQDGETCNAAFTITCGNMFGHSRGSFNFNCNNSYGFSEFIETKDAIERFTPCGTLTIEVHLQVHQVKKTWLPPTITSRSTEWAQLYAEYRNGKGDMKLHIGGKHFCVHRLVIEKKANSLYTFFMNLPKTTKEFSVLNSFIDDADIFNLCLEFIYLGKTPQINDELFAVKILEVSHRIGCSDLEMFTERVVVDKFLTVHNASHWLLRSDQYYLPLIKESSIDMIVTNWEDVMSTDEFCEILKSKDLAKDIINYLCFCSSGETKSTNEMLIPMCNGLTVRCNLYSLSITSIRKRLISANVAIDGNKEILVKRLKKVYSGQPE